jgi:hypothetical protein
MNPTYSQSEDLAHLANIIFSQIFTKEQNTMSTLNRRIQVNQTIHGQADITKARGKFIVASYTEDNGFSLAVNPVVHDSAIAARTECTRLSKLNPGKTFVFLQITGGELQPAMAVSF